MPGEIVASNDLLKDRADKLRTLFNADHSLRLWSNDFAPSPADTLAKFTESTFPGYARVSLAGVWGPVMKVIDGEYAFSSSDITFTPTGPTTEKAYGWMIVGDGKVKFSCRLPFPLTMTLGAPLTVRANCILWAAAIL